MAKHKEESRRRWVFRFDECIAPGHQAHHFNSSTKRESRAKPKSTYVRYAIQICAKHASMDQPIYLSLKYDFLWEFGIFSWEASTCTRISPWLKAFACVGSSRERKVQVPKSSERFCCVKICRDESSKQKPFWELEMSLWVIVRS